MSRCYLDIYDGCIENVPIMSNRPPFAPCEWYHCYSRGVDKRNVFENKNDYERFLQLLYLINSEKPIHRSDLHKKTTSEIMMMERSKPIVAIAAYSLMRNHFHILLKEIFEGGISRFMRTLGIAYAMYFNIKNERVGNLFVKPFRSKHAEEDRYFKYVTQYIHLNSIEIFEPRWKDGSIRNFSQLEDKIRNYRYSSLQDYCKIERPEKNILDLETFEWLKDELPPLRNILPEAVEYYQDLSR